MINLLVAYDDTDPDLGDYFKECFDKLSAQIATNKEINSTHIRGVNCSEENINTQIAAYNKDHFIFISFSHGNEEQLLTEDEVFVSNGNSHSFHKSLFYTSACSCCTILGADLIAKGCLTFIGYNGTVDICEGYYDMFIECENHAITEFLTSTKTIGEAFLEMKEKYNETIDKLWLGDVEDVIVASWFVSNRDKLELLGDENLTISDFLL